MFVQQLMLNKLAELEIFSVKSFNSDRKLQTIEEDDDGLKSLFATGPVLIFLHNKNSDLISANEPGKKFR